MGWKNVGSAVANVAPILGTILGGPLGGAAGGLIKLLAGELGLNPETTTPDDVMNVIKADPQALLKFKEFELNNRVELQKLVLEHDRVYLVDRADARAREKAIVQATGKKDINQYVLAWLVVGLFFLLVGILMFIDLPTSNIGPINQLFGAMATGFGMVLSYYFGSSKGSSDKTTTMVSQFQDFIAQIKEMGTGDGKGIEKMI